MMMMMMMVMMMLLSSATRLRPEDFGAKGNGLHNDTRAFMKTLEACETKGGCEIVLTSKKTYLTGPLSLISNLTLHIEDLATLQSMSREHWLENEWKNEAFLTAYYQTNLRIEGGGTIDGNGSEWWNHTKDDRHYRPHLFKLHTINRLSIDGVRFSNSANHHVYVENCTNVRVRNILVEAPSTSPNTDGINFSGGRDQLLEDSHISNGDDCISVVCDNANQTSRHDDMGYGGNVHVKNVTCVHGHGISIGSVRHGVVRNVTMENITLWYAENGPRIKTYPNSTGLVSDITYRNIRLHDVERGLFINGEYCPKSQSPYPCPPGKNSVLIENVLFEDIRGSVNSADGIVGSFNCSSLNPCKNIALRDIDLTTTSTQSPASFQCSCISGPDSHSVSPKSCI